jgi:hypothetical protein
MVEVTQASIAMMLEGGLHGAPSTITSKHNREDHLANPTQHHSSNSRRRRGEMGVALTLVGTLACVSGVPSAPLGHA